ncbi:outer membrane beta-barrel protein [Lewinella sp. JB7]|uniref:outer membrane beta-barrel protein n=1 Tax=Lewinella sp. JB7 TaxID=2962887 RepID=UPI0020C9B3C0|nr:outer membrane beta-barrel protein [Lewinella sp. JB7]MCP9236872.1 PorT family protein [Lewinella sp. JB7]
MMQLLPILLLLALPQVLCSQQDSSDFRRLQIGLVGGEWRHFVDFTPTVDVLTLTGRSYGVAVRYFDKQLVGFQAELTHAGSGWRENYGDGVYERRIDYAELQLLTQFSVGRGVVQPMLQLGPYLSVPLTDTEVLPAGFDPDLEPDNTYRGRELPFRLNYGLRAGLGFNIEAGPLTLQADGRILQGFSNLLKPGESQVATSIRQGYGAHVALFYAIR